MKEYERLKTEVHLLLPHEFSLDNNKNVIITFEVFFTMFDGKCVNTIVNNKATCRCPICFRTTSEFINSSLNFAPVDEKFLQLGLSLLHCEIKAFEHLLHISYRLTIKTWNVNANLKGIYKY